MENNKRDRAALKSYFKTNAVPTEGNFADLIEGTLNLREDGIARPPGDPLAIEAAGEAGSQKNVLQLYESFADTAPAWVLGLRPINASSVQKQGLSISEKSGGVSRLFIDRASGNVGVGTIEPAARLHVAGDLRVDGALQAASIAASNGLKIPAGQPVSGVQVIDFAILSFELDYTYPGSVDNQFTKATQSFTFSQPVVKVQAVVQGYHIGLKHTQDAVLWSMRFETTSSINGKTVTVDLVAGESTKAVNVHRFAYVSVLVIAVLQNAV